MNNNLNLKIITELIVSKPISLIFSINSSNTISTQPQDIYEDAMYSVVGIAHFILGVMFTILLVLTFVFTSAKNKRTTMRKTSAIVLNVVISILSILYNFGNSQIKFWIWIHLQTNKPYLFTNFSNK